ncbi:MAG: hypothetical protein K0M48_05360 [Thiobacillus sp.]|nr:hypothetical protein [Thiobacillus sp.]
MMTNSLQRGYAAIQARNFVDAVRWFEKALAETPEDAQAMPWLGQTLCSLGRRAEGSIHLRQSGQHLLEKARLSGDINRVLEIARQLQQWGVSLARSRCSVKPCGSTIPSFAGFSFSR